MAPHWVGPNRVIECVGNNTYHLNLPLELQTVHPMVNVSWLKVYLGSIVPPPHLIELENTLEYCLAAIISHCTAGWQIHHKYLV